jgi:hypothetical protein
VIDMRAVRGTRRPSEGRQANPSAIRGAKTLVRETSVLGGLHPL